LIISTKSGETKERKKKNEYLHRQRGGEEDATLLYVRERCPSLRMGEREEGGNEIISSCVGEGGEESRWKGQKCLACRRLGRPEVGRGSRSKRRKGASPTYVPGRGREELANALLIPKGQGEGRGRENQLGEGGGKNHHNLRVIRGRTERLSMRNGRNEKG